MLTKAAFIWSNLVLLIKNGKKSRSWVCKDEFSAAINPVFSVTWSFRNHWYDDLIVNVANKCAA